jgi:hypothetical protein
MEKVTAIQKLYKALMKQNKENDKFRVVETGEGSVNIIFEDNPEVTRELLTKEEWTALQEFVENMKE